MIANKILRKWANNEPVLNGWLSIACPFTAEIMAAQGYDSVTIDLQHGLVGYEMATAMLQAMRASGITPMVRVPWLDPAAIMKTLDAGAYGVICPMVNNRAEAEQLVSYVRYPPHGVRSFGPTRANFSAGTDYGTHADQEIICLAMIETAEAVANLEEILSTPGLNGVYIGPADLTMGLTGRKYRTGFDREEPEIVEAIQSILQKAHRANLRACLHNGNPAYAAKAISWGFDLVTISNDVRLLADSARSSVEATRSLIGGTQLPSADSCASGGY
ncbi:HpcH/HpaI aldolase family protein [Acidocella aminolytica]|jgi:4-hydroxy-2-oxoheptanedioate aldolase|uniref:2,4-dihydroxyhept-2-ene-1,7-dioic acid aldolase n=1 Tax=Acidocella aminolytica 101 = DSM 11237 TaxID=1120923 RepID=A0A0D6PH41_9PROT|nr:aldolase/citrate lyase family protein [Acidocella aminolytica]GAN80533.1 2,4-dihydroxyhept-2-ene-1,7-dioic acid aldolase [Acidocella aminolytica 101 = DSM 11237]GBQ37738.1 2,4-dihydroxyhept-2-ene-1,7-dioic acid aldolase [Acidocella aminolytica 101 = DSM 11237]SHF40026.1 4-hydroxy-2-oxoheptanedioate aldolase [Acidocella aminolytica 101 = DSM 11237]